MSNIIISPESGILEFNNNSPSGSAIGSATAPIRLDATGGNSFITGSNFGIGTSQPQFTLDVDGSIHGTSGNFQTAITVGGNPVMTGASPEADTLQTVTNRGATTTNSVGIGTTSANGLLQVGKYTVASQGNQGTYGNLSSFANSDTDNIFLGLKNGSYPNRGFAFRTVAVGVNSDFTIYEHGQGSAEVFRITAGGNIGIGTTAPSRKFEIHENTTNLTIGEKNGYAPSVYGPVIETNANAITLPRDLYLAGSQANVRNISSVLTLNGDNGIAFRYYDGSSGQEGMRLTNAGKVGIGTTSPDASTLLHVQGVIGTTNGSAAAPTHSFYGDPDNGMFRAAVNTLGFSTAGTERLRIDSAGSVIVGTATVAAANAAADNIVIKGEGTAVGLTISNSSNAGTGTIFFGDAASSAAAGFRYNHNTGDMAISAEDNVTFACDNVGIGTTSPTDKLDVAGALRLTSNITFDATKAGRIYKSSNLGLAFHGVTGSSNDFAMFTPAGQLMIVNPTGTNNVSLIPIAAGNVGIGTTSPTSKLHVSLPNQALGFNSSIFASANPSDYTVGRGSGITFQNADVYTGGVYGIREANNWTGALAFYTHTSSANNTFGSTFTEKMRITSSGNVGIGTTGPSVKLEVKSGGADDGFYLQRSSNTNPIVGLVQTGTGDGALLLRNASNVQTVILRGQGNSSIIGGNVGIGILAPTFKLHVKSDDSNDDIAYIHHDNPSQSSGTVLKVRSDAGDSSGYSLLDVSNNTGNALYVRGDRNVGIGTTNPIAKLHIKGSKSYSLGYLDATSDLHIGNQTMSSAVGAYAGSITFGSTNEAQLQAASIVAIQTDTDPNEIGLAFFTQHSQFGSTDLVESMRIRNDGNVGIGTTDPETRLDVVGDGVSGRVALQVTNTGSADGVHIKTANSIANNGLVWFQGSTALVNFYSNSSNYGILEMQKSGAGATVQVSAGGITYFNGGNVGIGTTNPSAKLDIDSVFTFNTSTDLLTITNNQNTGGIKLSGGNSRIYFGNYRAIEGDQSGGTLYIGEGYGAISLMDDVTIAGNVTATNILTIAGAATGSPYLQFTQGGSQKAYIQYVDSGDSFELQTDNQLVLRTGGSTTALTINSSQNATFAGDVTVSGGDITLGGTGRIQGIDTVSSGTDATSKTYVDNAITSGLGSYLPLAGGTLTGNLTIAKTDPTITLYDNSGANTDPNGTIIFSEVANTTNFDINYNGADDRLEFRGRISSTLTDLVHIKRSLTNTLQVLGTVTVDGGNITLGGTGRIQGIDTVTASTDAANKAYVDAQVGSADTLQEVTDNGNTTTNSITFAGGTSTGDILLGAFNKISGVATDNLVIGVDKNNASGNSSIDFQLDGSTSALFINNSRNVGIGTTSPLAKTHIQTASAGTIVTNVSHDDLIVENSSNCGIQLSSPASSYQYLAFGDTASANTGYVRYYHASDRMDLRAGGTDTLSIVGGNVGIGTTGPDEKLHINGSVNGNVKALIQNTNSGSSAYATLGFQNNLPHSVQPSLFLNGTNNTNYAGANSLNMYQHGSYNLGFVTNNTLRMVVAGGGNVGIGTTNPAKELDVVGTVRAVDASFNDQHQLRPTQLISYATDAIINAQSAGDDVRLNTQSNTVLIATAEGNVGIGTTSPTAARLVVHNAGNDPQILLKNTAGSNAQILFEDNDGGTQNASITFDQTGQNTLTIATGYQSSNDLNRINIAPAGNVGLTVRGGTGSSNGNVGIGNSSPQAKLHITGTVNTDDTKLYLTENTNLLGGYFKYNGDANINFIGGLDTTERPVISYPRDGSTLSLSTGSSTALHIDSSRNVGIGTTSPDRNLHVRGSSAIARIESTASSQNSQLDMKSTTATWSVGQNISLANTGTLEFYNGSSSPFVIKTDGKVGIGTTSPDSKLHVASGNVLISNNQFYTAENTGGTNYKLAGLTSGNVIQIGAIDYTSASTVFAGGDNLRLTTGGASGTTRLYINSSGNVGIGTTSPSEKLHVNGNVRGASFGTFENTTARIFSPEGATFNGNGNQTGYLIVKLPDNAGAGINNMMTGIIRVFDYANNESFDVHFAGYWYSGYSWTRCSAWIESEAQIDRNFSVRFGRTTGASGSEDRPFITIGESNSTWSYCKFSVVEYNSGHSNPELEKWNSGWDATLSATFPGTLIVNVSNNQVNNWKRNGQDVYYAGGTGNVGIGTTSPAHKLTINAANNTTALGIDFPSAHFDFSANSTSGYNTIFHMDNTGLDIGHDSSYRSLNLKTGGSDRLVIEGGGNVGIGTTSPATKLHVVGRARFDDTQINAKGVYADYFSSGQSLTLNSGASASILFKIGNTTALTLDSSENATFAGDIGSIGTIGVTQSDGDYLAKLYQSSADGFLELFTGQATPTSRTKITSYGDSYINPSNGNVGIGTTGPSSKLHVAGSSSDGVLVSGGSNNRNTKLTGSGLVYSTTSTGGWAMGNYVVKNSDGSTLGQIAGGFGGANTLTYTYYGGTAYNNAAMYILSSNKNVGIGTASPDSRLELAVASTTDMVINANDRFKIKGNGTATWGNSASNGELTWDNGYAIIQGQSGNGLKLAVNNSVNTGITINTSGNVGIGTTSVGTINGVAFSSVGLHVKASTLGRTITEGSSWGEYIMNHSGASANQRGKFIQSKSGNFNLGSYDDNGTQRVQMTVLNDGKVGIGTNSPDTKLHVLGSDYENFTVQSSSSGYAPASVICEAGNSNARGAGIFMHNTINDRIWYAGTMYNNDTAAWNLCYNSDASALGAGRTSMAQNSYSLFTVTNTGNVGIGTTGPSRTLHIVDSAGPTIKFQRSSSADLEFTFGTANASIASAGEIQFRANGGTTNKFIINNSQIQSNAKFLVNTNSGIDVHTSDSGNILLSGNSSATGNPDQFFLKHNLGNVELGNSRGNINITSGNVGIGTTSPAQKLDVDGNIVAARFIQDTNAGNDFYAAGFTRSSSSLTSPDIYDLNGHGLVLGGTSNESTLVLKSGGNVGIGTTSPSQKLTVAGNIDTVTAMGVAGQWASSQIRLETTNTVDNTGWQGISFDASTANNYGWSLGVNRSGSGRGSFRFYEHVNNASGTARFTIEQDGNVGIGTTNPAQKLHVNGNVDIDNGGILIQQAYGINFGVSGYDIAMPTTTRLGIKTAGTEHITILNTGKVGIGTTGPSNKLDVSGGIAIGASYVGNTAPSNGAIIQGNVGIGVTSASYALQVGGSIVGTSKSFLIKHPTKEGKKLLHACIEGPENGVYYRGKSTSNIIEMPDYWIGLVHIDSMTVDITAIGPNQDIYVDSISDDGDVTIGSNTDAPLNYFYVIYGERKDIGKLETEIDDPD